MALLGELDKLHEVLKPGREFAWFRLYGQVVRSRRAAVCAEKNDRINLIGRNGKEGP
jgi:hypothetical protein